MSGNSAKWQSASQGCQNPHSSCLEKSALIRLKLMEVTVVAAAAVIVIVVYDQGLSERSPFVLMPRKVEIN